MSFGKDLEEKGLVTYLISILPAVGILALLISVDSSDYELWLGTEWMALLAIVFVAGIGIFLWSVLEKKAFYLSLGAVALAEIVFLASCQAAYLGITVTGVLIGIFILLGCAIIGGVLLYFLPTILAFRKKKENRTAIFVLNLFLGGTLIFWVLSLVWALKKE